VDVLSQSSLTVISIIIDFIGLLLFTFTAAKEKAGDKTLSDAKRFIEGLQLEIEDLEETPKTPGLKTKDGLDISSALGILEEAAKRANRVNRRNALDKMEQVERENARRRPLIVTAWGCIAVALVLQIIVATMY